jgi:hypothetical protein
MFFVESCFSYLAYVISECFFIDSFISSFIKIRRERTKNMHFNFSIIPHRRETKKVEYILNYLWLFSNSFYTSFCSSQPFRKHLKSYYMVCRRDVTKLCPVVNIIILKSNIFFINILIRLYPYVLLQWKCDAVTRSYDRTRWLDSYALFIHIYYLFHNTYRIQTHPPTPHHTTPHRTTPTPTLISRSLGKF